MLCGELPVDGLVDVERIDIERVGSGSASVDEFAPASPERKVASPPVEQKTEDQKTAVSRRDSAPTVAPVPRGAPVAPGAKPTPEDLELLKEAAAAPAWPPPGKKLGKSPTVKNFEAFWKPFRAALLAPDMDALAKMTTFSFRALSESDPVRTVERAEFPRLVRRQLAQDTGLDVGGHESHQEYVKRLPAFTKTIGRGQRTGG
jgi:hypothetical protein